jgi:hypothetical protein
LAANRWWLLPAVALGLTALTAAEAGAASNETKVDSGGKVTVVEDGPGMSAANPRVKQILEAHPNDFVVICVAGCDGKPKAVQILPRPTVGRVGENVPTAAPLTKGKATYGPPKPGAGERAPDVSNDVVCLAGCSGKPGTVLQRMTDLPPPTARSTKPAESKVLPERPSDKPDKSEKQP